MVWMMAYDESLDAAPSSSNTQRRTQRKESEEAIWFGRKEEFEIDVIPLQTMNSSLNDAISVDCRSPDSMQTVPVESDGDSNSDQENRQTGIKLGLGKDYL